jgi:hypothetical protein
VSSCRSVIKLQAEVGADAHGGSGGSITILFNYLQFASAGVCCAGYG